MLEQNPYLPKHEFADSGPPVTSLLAIASLIFGLISPLLLCVCDLSLLTSLVAIITGHVALGEIRSSAGQLVGRGMAMVGLFAGYMMLLISVAVLVVLIVPAFRNGGRNADELNELFQSDRLFDETETESDANWQEDSFDPVPDWNPPDLPAPSTPSPSTPAPSNPDLDSPDGTPATRRTRPPTIESPKSPRATAPQRKPGLMDNVPVSKDVVQEFPDMGWAVESLAFAPHGRWLAAGKMDRRLLILDVQTGVTRNIAEKLDELSSLKQVAFSPDGKLVAAGGSTGAIVTWNIDEAGILSNAQSLTQHANSVRCLAMSPTAPFLLTGSNNGELIWQPYVNSPSAARKQKTLPRGALAVYLPPEALDALATDGSTLVRVDLKTSQVIATQSFPRASAQAAAFSSDGGKLAVTDGYKVQVWDTATGLSLGTLDGDHEMQWSVTFLPDGKRLVSGGRGFATLWNLETREAECRFDLGGILYIQTLAISPDGTLLAAIPAAAGQTLTVLRIPE